MMIVCGGASYQHDAEAPDEDEDDIPLSNHPKQQAPKGCAVTDVSTVSGKIGGDGLPSN